MFRHANARLAELERKEADKKRREAGGIVVPDDGEDSAEGIIVEAFGNLFSHMKDIGIKMDEVVLLQFQDVEEETVANFKSIIREWKKAKLITDIDAKGVIKKKIDSTFEFLNSIVYRFDRDIDIRFFLLLTGCERRMHGRLNILVTGWK
jgi:hypothetical protein